jgi:hypothetical protein
MRGRIPIILFILLLGLVTTLTQLSLLAANDGLGANAPTEKETAAQPVAASIVGEDLIPLDWIRFSREETHAVGSPRPNVRRKLALSSSGERGGMARANVTCRGRHAAAQLFIGLEREAKWRGVMHG